MSDFRTLFRHPVPDLAIDGQGCPDAILTAQEKLRSRRFVMCQEHLRGKECTHIVRHYSRVTCQLLDAAAERIPFFRKCPEAVDHSAAIGRTDSAYGYSRPNDFIFW